MTDGTGTKQHSYVPVGSLGALQLQQESGLLANSAIAYSFDRGRPAPIASAKSRKRPVERERSLPSSRRGER